MSEPSWSGGACVCFIVDAGSTMSVGWRVASRILTYIDLDALSMASGHTGVVVR